MIKRTYKLSEISTDGVRIPILKLLEEKEVKVKGIKVEEQASHMTLEKLTNALLKDVIDKEKEGYYVEYVLLDEEKGIEVRAGWGSGAKGELAKWPTRLLRFAVLKENPKGQLELDKLKWYEAGDDVYLFEGKPQGNFSAILFMTEDGAYLHLSEEALERDITEIEEEEEGSEEEEEEQGIEE